MSISAANQELRRLDGMAVVLTFGAVLIASGSCAGAACTGPAALEATLRSAPTADAYTQLAGWFTERKQPGCAVEALEHAVHLEPASLPSHINLAAALDGAQRPTEAEVEWRAALNLDPQSAKALSALAGHLMTSKDYGAVISLLRGRNSLDPDLTVDLALAYGRSGMLYDAAAALRKGLVANPSSLPLNKALAGVLVMQSRQQEAEDLLKVSMEQNPGDLGVKLLYMRMLVMEDEPEKARKLGEQLLTANPNNWEVQYLNGLLERRSGEYTSARDHLQRAVALNEGNVDAQQNLGSVLAKLKDAAGAKEHLERSIALARASADGNEGQPQDPEVLFELSMVLRSLGETAEADKQLKIYQQQAQAKSDMTQAAAKAAFADQKLAGGNTAEAIQLYRDALLAAPNQAPLAYKLAMALDKSGDLGGERAALEQAINIDPHMAEAQNQLGYLASRAGETQSAEEHFRLAVGSNPGYITAWINLSATLLLESKLAASQEAVNHVLQLDPNNPQAQKLEQALKALSAQP